MDTRKICEKWQKAWQEARLFEADPDPNRPKVFITFPFPYMNGPLHLGHAFTAARADAYARFKRMQGYNVLFPWAWHWTGVAVAGASERIKLGDKRFIESLVKIDGVPEEEVRKFVDPEYMVRYYTKANREVVKRFGLAIDWRREFYTSHLNEGFSRFVTWQYRKLLERGLIVKGTHPVVWCPRCKSPTGDADRLEGCGVSPEEYILYKFKLDSGWFLVAATFRPETIFGATNVWVNPDATYVKVLVDGEPWIISKEAAIKLQDQLRRVEVQEEFSGRELIGQWVTAPVTGARLIVFPASFVDPSLATGVVYSVPGHAPLDYLALRDLQRDPSGVSRYGLDPEYIRSIKPISIILVEGFGDYPAVEAVERLGVKDQLDPRAEEATQLVYKREFHQGIMKSNCGKYAGIPVREAKVMVAEEAMKRGEASTMYDLPRPVICRCTTPCHVKILEDQWFLDYENDDWKALAHAALDQMQIFPEGVRESIRYTIDWLRKWPCTRRTGLGTPAPWDRSWIIETLSDSTIYMAYYIVAKYVNSGRVKPNQLTDTFFDYVLLGEGTAEAVAEETGLPVETVEEIRREFEYWYPVDLRVSGKDLVSNHLTFFIFHHCAIFPSHLWPRSIAVNGFVRVRGEEMHKSKGNFIPLHKAIEQYGSDVIRIVLLRGAEGLDDPDWRDEATEAVRTRIQHLFTLIDDLRTQAEARQLRIEDRWMLSVLQRRIAEVTEALERMRTRTAIETAFYLMWSDIRRYLRRCERPAKQVVNKLLDVWVRLLTPFMPHVTEELWVRLGNQPFVADAPWPKPDKDLVDEYAEEAETYLDRLVEDIREILRVVSVKPRLICIYVASNWKRELFKQVLKLEDPRHLGRLIRECAQQEGYPSADRLSKVLKQMLRVKISMGPERSSRLLRIELNELEVLMETKAFLEREFRCEVRIFNEDDPDKYDPLSRSKQALPYKPAVYIEGEGARSPAWTGHRPSKPGVPGSNPGGPATCVRGQEYLEDLGRF